MLRIDPEIVGVDIVLVGEFNPTIFSPRWFSSNGLLREGAADGAEVHVIHPEVADFTAEWLRVQVTRTKFTASTVQAPFPRLQDLVCGVFRDCMYHTPLRGVGINYSVHFLVDSATTRNRIGYALAPLAPWGPWGERLDFGGGHGGMTALRMSQRKPKGRDEGGQINVTVEPSNRVGSSSGRGVFVTVNDHFAGDGDAERLMATLAREFESSVCQSEQIVDHVMSLAHKDG